MTPALLRTVLTSVPMVVLAVWIPLLLSRLWRRALWHDVGPELRDLAETRERSLAPVLFGWGLPVEGGMVSWRGTPLGVYTVVRIDGTTRRLPGLITEPTAWRP